MVLSLEKLATEHMSKNSQHLVKCFHRWVCVRKGGLSDKRFHFSYIMSDVKCQETKFAHM